MKLLTLLLIIISLNLSGQTWSPVVGNYKYKGLWAENILITPSDTTNNKAVGSIAIKNNNLYIKKTNKWDLLISSDVLAPYLQKSDTVSLVATKHEINLKVDKATGKALSDNNFTDADSIKLSTLQDSLLARYTKTQANTIFATLTHSQAINTITGLQDSLLSKVQKVAGKQLSTEDYSTAEKNKLAGIASGAEVNVNPDWNASSGDAQILNKPSLNFEPANANIQAHIGRTDNPHVVTKTQVGLPYADNTSDADKPVSTAVQTALNGKEDLSNKSTDVSADGTSDTKYPSVKAVKTYADGLVVGLLDDRGSYDPTATSLYPASGGSGAGGAILKGDIWYISVAGTINGKVVSVGSSVRAVANSPGQSDANWDILNVGLGYVPENVANKVTSISSGSTDTQYPSAKLLYDQLALKQASGSYLTSESDPAFTGWNKSSGISITKSQVSDFPTQLSQFANNLGNYGGFALGSDLTNHANQTTTAHGLGASAFHADNYFSLSGHDHAGVYDPINTASGLLSTHNSTYDHSHIATAYGWGNWADHFGTGAGTIAQGNDSRLSDARNPTAGSSYYIQNQNSGPQSANSWIDGFSRAGRISSISGVIDYDGASGSNFFAWSSPTLSSYIGGILGWSLTKSGSVGNFDVTGTISATGMSVTAAGTDYTGYSLQGTQTGDVQWNLFSGYPNAGDFSIRQTGVITALKISKTTGNALFAGTLEATGAITAPSATISNSSNAYINIDAANSGGNESGLWFKIGGVNKWEQYTAANDGNWNLYSQGNGIKLSLTPSGNLTTTGAATATGNMYAPDFVQTSDSTLKRNVKPIQKKFDFNFYQYSLKSDSTNRLRYGVIAQEIEKDYPEFVYTQSNGKKGVTYTGILIAKVAQMDGEIKSLKSDRYYYLGVISFLVLINFIRKNKNK